MNSFTAKRNDTGYEGVRELWAAVLLLDPDLLLLDSLPLLLWYLSPWPSPCKLAVDLE